MNHALKIFIQIEGFIFNFLEKLDRVIVLHKAFYNDSKT